MEVVRTLFRCIVFDVIGAGLQVAQPLSQVLNLQLMSLVVQLQLLDHVTLLINHVTLSVNAYPVWLAYILCV